MKITKEFEKEIAPFFWVEHEESASVCLNVGEYLQEIFDTREDEGFEGSGYDWGSLAPVSYTHLDVYKRQGSNSAKGSAKEGNPHSGSAPCSSFYHRCVFC